MNNTMFHCLTSQDIQKDNYVRKVPWTIVKWRRYHQTKGRGIAAFILTLYLLSDGQFVDCSNAAIAKCSRLLQTE